MKFGKNIIAQSPQISERDWGILRSGNARVNFQTNLATPDSCRIALTLYSSQPKITEQEARKLANKVIESYPYKSTAKVGTGYVEGITDVFSRYPNCVSAAAADYSTLASKFIPSRADVYDCCEAIASEHRSVATIARLHLEEHGRRKADEERLKNRATPEEMAEIRAKIG